MRGRRPSGTVAGMLVTGLLLAGAVTNPADAAPAPVSQATGRFLSGRIGNTSLDTIAAIAGEQAVNSGGAANVKQHHLDAALLDQQLLNLPNGLRLPGLGVLTLGAVNQYARAMPDGSAYGASGAVSNGGALSVGGADGAPADAMLDIGAPGQVGANGLGSVSLRIGALSAAASQAAGVAGAQSGSYRIASLTVTLSSPALAQAIGAVTAQLQNLLAMLPSSSGLALPALGNVVGSCDVSSLKDAVSSFGEISFGGGAIAGNLASGSLTIDVATLLTSVLHLDLNRLPPNTHLFEYVAQALPQALAGGLTQLQTTLTDLFDKLTDLTDGVCQGNAAATLIDPLSPLGEATLKALTAPIAGALAMNASGLSSTLFVPLAKQLQNLIDPVVNVQERAGGTFTERALRLDLVGDPFAVIDLASASVGPSSARSVAAPPSPTSSGPRLPETVPTPAPTHLASTGAAPWLTKVGLFGLLGVCLGTALFGATIGLRRGRHG